MRFLYLPGLLAPGDHVSQLSRDIARATPEQSAAAAEIVEQAEAIVGGVGQGVAANQAMHEAGTRLKQMVEQFKFR